MQHDERKARTYTRFVKHDERLRRMIADPECTGDLFLIGLALARMVDLDGWPPKEERTFEYISRGYFPDGAGWSIRHALDNDVRRYEPEWMRRRGNGVCEAPMVRRDGACGRPGNNWHPFHDPATGESYLRHACGRPEHRTWLAQVWREHRSEMLTVKLPTPFANKGGVLARHIPEVKWDDLYRNLRSGWSPPPERTESGQKPTLTLIVGGVS